VNQLRSTLLSLLASGALVTGIMQAAYAHHSFAMYDANRILVFTGVVTRVHPDANHLQIYFVPLNDERNGIIRLSDGEPEVWAVEMAGAAQAARQGVTVSEFPAGTIISVALHPLRSGERAGERSGGLFRCPDRVRPDPGQHCDSVEGHRSYGAHRGSDQLPEPLLSETQH
jgi:hypothetical protein